MMFITVALGLVSLGHVVSAATPTTTGKFHLTNPGQCDISLKSVGGGVTFQDIKRTSYIKVNGLTYVDSFVGKVGYRGFNLLQLDINTCKGVDFDHFDTFDSGAQANRLTNYINGIPDGTHILGVVIDGAFNALNAGAKAALKSIGIDTTGLVHFDKLLFHVVKGDSSKAIVKISKKAVKEDLLHEEKAEKCGVCKNGGLLAYSEEAGLSCDCPAGFGGFLCEIIGQAD